MSGKTISHCRILDKLEEQGIGAADVRRSRPKTFFHAAVVCVLALSGCVVSRAHNTADGLAIPLAASRMPVPGANKTIAEAACTADKLGRTIPSPSIGEPVASVALSAPKWTAATSTIPAYCSVDNSMVTAKEE